ncbi:MAG: shikimate kinase [Patescibacteria group bacterium]
MKGITLIGMPGAGKSTIGKALAGKLGFRFVDLDFVIKEKEGKSHSVLLEKLGPEKFIELEGSHALGIDLSKTVFSPGGSIVYSPEAMKKLRSETLIIYLELPLQEIRRRLGRSAETRGIVGLAEKGLAELFKERTPLYQSFASHTVACLNLKDREVVNKITEFLS